MHSENICQFSSFLFFYIYKKAINMLFTQVELQTQWQETVKSNWKVWHSSISIYLHWFWSIFCKFEVSSQSKIAGPYSNAGLVP